MKNLAQDYWVDQDDGSFVLAQKKTRTSGKSAGSSFLTNFTYHSSPEMVSRKLCDIGVQKYIDKDWLQCVEFVNEAHENFKEWLRGVK